MTFISASAIALTDCRHRNTFEVIWAANSKCGPSKDNMAEAIALLDASKQFPGMTLAPGSKFVLEDPESGMKIKLERPKDGLVKRIRKSFTKRDKSAPTPGPQAYQAGATYPMYEVVDIESPHQAESNSYATTETYDTQGYMNVSPAEGWVRKRRSHVHDPYL